LDYAARVLFFALAPFAIVRAAALFPVWGALISVLIALLVFVGAETVRGWAASSWIVRRALSRELAIEEHYRVHPPRPFAYYVFYPLLFPFWLANREARREFWLFKGYTLVTVAIMLISAVAQYTLYYPPQLGAHHFLPILGLTVAVETLLVLGLLMPIATTVIGFHLSGHRWRLVVLLALMMVSTGLATWQLARPRDPVVSYATRARVWMRERAQPKRSREAHLAAVKAAFAIVEHERSAVDVDGKVVGVPLERARQALAKYYKDDETYAFDLWWSVTVKPKTQLRTKTLILYAEPITKGRREIWVAWQRVDLANALGVEITDPKALPSGAFLKMRRAAED
jgi:hypothetical protein